VSAEPASTGPAAAADVTIAVEVAWSLSPRTLRSAALRLPAGATARDALAAAGWPELAASAADDDAFAAAGWSVAVWSRGCALGHALRDGDRVEVLRALQVAPMEARRARYRKSGGVREIRARNARPPKG